MHTFRKLPTTAPKAAATTMKNAGGSPSIMTGGGVRCLGSTGSGEIVEDCENRDATIRA